MVSICPKNISNLNNIQLNFSMLVSSCRAELYKMKAKNDTPNQIFDAIFFLPLKVERSDETK